MVSEPPFPLREIHRVDAPDKDDVGAPSATFHFSGFLPAEAARITTLSTIMQADWRKRQFLPINDGYARYDILELSYIWALKLLADRGIGPKKGQAVAAIIAEAIVGQMLQEPEAYSGEFERTHHWLPPSRRPRDEHYLSRDVLDYYDYWSHQSVWLATRAAKQLGIPWRNESHFIWFANEEFVFTDDLNDFLVAMGFGENPDRDERLSGAIVVLDIVALGRTLLKRFGRPTIDVEFSPFIEGVDAP